MPSAHEVLTEARYIVCQWGCFDVLLTVSSLWSSKKMKQNFKLRRSHRAILQPKHAQPKPTQLKHTQPKHTPAKHTRRGPNPEKWEPRRGREGPELWGPEVGFSWNFGGVFEGRDPQMCTFEVLGLSRETPGGFRASPFEAGL